MQRPYYTAPRITISDKHRYKEHKKAVRHPNKQVDDSAPPLPANTYIKVGILEKDAVRLAEVEAENRNLVKRLNIIGRTKGKIDCTTQFLLERTNYQERKRKNRKIETQNLEIYTHLQNAQSRYKKDDFMEEYKTLQSKIIENPDCVAYKVKEAESREWTITPANIDKNLLDPSKRIRCYFDIVLKGVKNIGRLIMEIWMDIAPVAGCNFVNLCKGYGEYSYKNTPIHRIVKDVFCIGGDVVNKTGTGIYTVYGGINKTFPDENTTLEFNGPGVLAAHTVFAGDNHSQFLITFKKLTSMNKHFIVFGRVVDTIRVLELVHGFGTGGGKPTKEIVIADCGVLGNVTIPDPTTITLPDRISPASTDDELELYAKKAETGGEGVRTVRKRIIKNSRNELKAMNMPCHKLNMTNRSIDCTKIAGTKITISI